MNLFEIFAKNEIVGEDRALELIGSVMDRIGKVKLFKGVTALLTLTGPPACGKSFSAKVIARFLEREMLVLHMDEFAFADDLVRLFGKDGMLEAWIHAHPYGIVIFEDIDKADYSIQRALGAIISDGASDDPRRYQEAIFLFTFSLNDPAWYNKHFIESYYDNPLLNQGKFYEEIAKVASVGVDGTPIPLFDQRFLAILSQGDLALFNLLELKELCQIGEWTLEQTAEDLQHLGFVKVDLDALHLLSLGLLLGFSPYINVKRITSKLPALLIDRLLQSGNSAKRYTLTVSKKVEEYLHKLFLSSFDLKYFIKLERHYELSWKTHQRGSHVTITLDAIDEIEPQKVEKDSPYADRLALQRSHISFHDVAGQLRVKDELRAIIQLLQNEKGLKHFDITLPKGLLLYGPEGVGKTMLVKAFAKEAGLPLIDLRNMDLFDEVLIQSLYLRAHLVAPVIVILEGVDTKVMMDGSIAHIPTDMLCEMIDRASSEPRNYVFTIATAQNLEEVPQELLRPERIDQSVEVPELDREARRFFAQKILEKPHDESINIERIIRYMSRMNGYELGRIAKEASLDALREGKDRLTEAIIIDCINTIKYGHKLERKRFKNFEEELKKSAYHEAAHAVTSMKLLPNIEIEQVTVIPRSQALGLVSYMQDAIETNLSKDEIEANIAVLLAGRLATVRKFGQAKGLETGAYSDLQEAALYAYSAVAQFGMDEELPNLHLETLLQTVNNNLFKEKLESRLAFWIESGTKLAESILEEEWETIEKIAQKLLKEEVIEGSELKSYLS